MANPQYKLEIDYGKPYTEEVSSMKNLKKTLLKLKDMTENEDVPYMDIDIFNQKGKLITEKIFKKLRLN